MIRKAMNQLPAVDGIETVGLLRPTHRLAAGLGSMSGGHPTQAYGGSEMFALPFWLPEPATLSLLRIANITVPAAAGKLARLGIARWTQGNAPSVLYQGGTVAIDGAGAKSLDCSADALRLSAGWHAALILFEAGVTAEYLYQGNETSRMFISHGTGANYYASSVRRRTGITFGTFPDPLGTWSILESPAAPLVYVEVTP